jgi:hypothetical protein
MRIWEGSKRDGPNGGVNGMPVDLGGVPFYLVDDVDFIGATDKHLGLISKG